MPQDNGAAERSAQRARVALADQVGEAVQMIVGTEPRVLSPEEHATRVDAATVRPEFPRAVDIQFDGERIGPLRDLSLGEASVRARGDRLLGISSIESVRPRIDHFSLGGERFEEETVRSIMGIDVAEIERRAARDRNFEGMIEPRVMGIPVVFNPMVPPGTAWVRRTGEAGTIRTIVLHPPVRPSLPTPVPLASNEGTEPARAMPVTTTTTVPPEPILPEFRAGTQTMFVALDRINVPDGTPVPSTDLVESVRTVGVLQPIAVRHVDGSNRYDVIDGARRTMAARTAGLENIPALLFGSTVTSREQAAMTLVTNTLRRGNPLRELEAIELLLASGADEAQIARELHIPRQTIRARARLSRLLPPLREALGDGRLLPAVADRVARLNANQQGRLVMLLIERRSSGDRLIDQRITMTDVRTVRIARQANAVAGLPGTLFGRPVVMVDMAAEVPRTRTEPEVRVIGENSIEIRIGQQVTPYLSFAEHDRLIEQASQARAVGVLTPMPEPGVEGWDAALALITRLPHTIPVEPDGDHERAHVLAGELETLARRILIRRSAPVIPVVTPPPARRSTSLVDLDRAVTRTRENTQANSTLMQRARATPSGDPLRDAERAVRQTPASEIAATLMVDGMRMFDTVGTGSGARYFRRMRDAQGTMRRRYMSESQWRAERRAAVGAERIRLARNAMEARECLT